jgi:hypothetical protein
MRALGRAKMEANKARRYSHICPTAAAPPDEPAEIAEDQHEERSTSRSVDGATSASSLSVPSLGFSSNALETVAAPFNAFYISSQKLQPHL